MMGEVLNFPSGDTPAGKILDGAAKQDLQEVLLVGRTDSGDIYMASSSGDIASILYLMERLRKRLWESM